MWPVKMNFLDVFLLKTKVQTTGKKAREKFIPLVDDHLHGSGKFSCLLYRESKY